MASPFKQLCTNTVNIEETKHDDLIRQSEQLRILKNFAKDEKVFKSDILELIEAMENNPVIEIKEVEKKEEEEETNE
jgi:hypothetical protein